MDELALLREKLAQTEALLAQTALALQAAEQKLQRPFSKPPGSLPELSLDFAARRTPLSQIIDNIPFSVYWKGLDNTFQGGNRQFAQHAGAKTIEELCGKNEFALPWPEIQAQFHHQCDRTVLETGLPLLDLTHLFQRADGTDVIVITSKVPLYDETDAVCGVMGIQTDITNHRKSEALLRQQLDFTQAITHSVGEGIYAIDRQGCITFINPAGERMLGWGPGEILGRRAHETFHYLRPSGERYPARECVMLRVLQDGNGVVNHEDFFIRQDGTMFPIRCSTAPILQDGQITGAVFTFQDMTEQHLIESRLRENEERLNLALESAKESVWDWNVQTGEAYFDDHWIAMIGYERAEIAPHADAWAQLIHPDDIIRVMEKLNLHLEGDAPVYEVEQRLRCKNGEWKWVLARGKVVSRDEQGRPVRMTGTNTDISERKQAQAELESSLKKQADLQFAMDVSTIVSVTDHHGTITYVNQAFCHISGYPEAELIGQNHRLLNAGHHSREYIKALWSTIAQGQVWKGELCNRAKNGSLYWVDTTIVPFLDEVGKPYQYVAIRHDITDRKRQQEELIQAREEALKAAHIKSDFLANMSHEIRTPMNGVIGMTGLLLDTPLSAEQREYTHLIQSSADSLLTIINDILDFSKLEAGKMELEPLPFDLQVTLDEQGELMSAMAQKQRLEFMIHYSPEVPRRIIGDPGRIRQIVQNLLTNAFKFTHEGHILLEVLCLEKTDRHARLKISVADTGIGIPKAQLQAIFDKFTQADTSTTRKYGGTGLGLAICKQLVEMMGGEIGVESTVGEGATFWFTLPVTLSDEIVYTKADPSELKGLRLLVVEDNLTNQRILCEWLNCWNIKYLAVSSGEAAIETLKLAHKAGMPYDIAIVDYRMPGMDGETLGRLIKQEPDLCRTRLVMLTSAGLRGDANRLRNVGFSAYLLKPISQTALLDALVTLKNMPVTDKEPLITRYTLLESHQRTQTVAGEEQSLPAKPARILLAEDNQINQKVTVKLLEKLGIEADVAANGLEVLAHLEKETYRLILMDCQMPEMDGFETTAEIRRAEIGGGHIPIIAVTANALKGEAERCLAAGMDDYLAKPIRFEQLKDILTRWLSDSPE